VYTNATANTSIIRPFYVVGKHSYSVFHVIYILHDGQAYTYTCACIFLVSNYTRPLTYCYNVTALTRANKLEMKEAMRKEKISMCVIG